jgi:hypothetical protein
VVGESTLKFVGKVLVALVSVKWNPTLLEVQTELHWFSQKVSSYKIIVRRTKYKSHEAPQEQS